MDAMNDVGPEPWHKIYVGILTRVAPHPAADREVVVEVDTGWARLTVVTGGPRVAGDDREVAVALPGARVFDAFAEAPRTTKLKQRRIRGVLSEAMLCSAKELGLSDDHAAIHLLAPEAPVGAPLAEALASGQTEDRHSDDGLAAAGGRHAGIVLPQASGV